ncbi:cytochrome c oxidase subunit I [Marinicauda algicola]|uniref:Cytochrome c oxidase subunit I n=1 Tax=Marinicauda algicola TaxID=2029849 RepID=A0A4S2H500_9PROT|nr:cbb3-type cytochrome c oxidase subunit I [Marinicauda algicola]TGY90623.1 cytochrome c oxidase subunit I [Marinicauda algicola]
MTDPSQERPSRSENFWTARETALSWFLTTDHKRVAVLYALTLIATFALGSVGAAIVRLELITPAGDLVSAEAYNRAFTLHGIVMVFFFLVPLIPATLGNFLLPLMLGAKDLAFPRLNLASWYVFVIGAGLAVAAIAMGGLETGWTFYTPLSSVYADGYVTLAILGVFVSGFASIFTGINFIVTTHTLRAPGMGWFQMPLFVWGMYATSLVMVLATPVLAVTLLLVIAERAFGIGVFDPAIGGDPLLFQHLFWFYSHPAVYIMILPALGVMSELVTAGSHNRIFGYRFVAFSSIAIAVLSFLVWGHHMFTSGQSMYGGIVFSFLSFLVAVPSAVKAYNWAATLYKGRITLNTPFLYALSFIGLFVFGGLTGLVLASIAVDVHVHDTYFVVAHFHYIMVGAAVTAFMGGLHFWWPKITGRLFNESLGRFSAVMLFLGFNLTFFPQFVLGYLGMPRRYHEYDPDLQIWNVLSSAGVPMLAVGYGLPLLYLGWSLKIGEKAGRNPWNAAGLEWTTTSPPPEHNFPEPPEWEGPAYPYPVGETEEPQVQEEAQPKPEREA